jgi:hypothetical protein
MEEGKDGISQAERITTAIEAATIRQMFWIHASRARRAGSAREDNRHRLASWIDSSGNRTVCTED